ncbi:hypothetical protein Tco_1102256 [Tanacetum coccineum]
MYKLIMPKNVISTNEAVNTAHEVSTANLQGKASLSSYADDVMFSFFVSQSKSPLLDNEDMEQIDLDDLEEMDLKWKGHFPRDCRAPRNQGNRNGDNARRVVPVETSANALVVQEGIGSSSSIKFRLLCLWIESEVLDNVVDSHECNQVNDRFKKSEGYHAVPPPFTGNFKPARADLSFVGLDDFVYKSKVSETITSVPNVETTVTKTSKDSLEKPKTIWFSAPIIEDWESDSEDENVFEPNEVKKIVKSSFENIEFVNARNSTVEKPKKFSQNPRDNKRNRNSFEFTKKACFVCGSFNYIIKDCDFHDKKMVQKPVLNNVNRGTGQREVRQVWNNAMRVNHQNFSNSIQYFAPTAVLTKSGIIPISAARQSSSRAATPASVVGLINTVAPKPFMNVARPRPNAFHKSHSPSRTPFNQQTTLKNKILKVNTAKTLVAFWLGFLGCVLRNKFLPAFCSNVIDTMADVNAPVEQAPAVAPPTRTDEQILPHIRWVPIGKSNCYLDTKNTNGVSTASTYLVLLELVNSARRMINTADGQSCRLGDKDAWR